METRNVQEVPPLIRREPLLDNLLDGMSLYVTDKIFRWTIKLKLNNCVIKMKKNCWTNMKIPSSSENIMKNCIPVHAEKSCTNFLDVHGSDKT